MMNLYDAQVAICTNALTGIRNQHKDPIRENARLQDELQKSAAELKDLRTKYTSLVKENCRLARGPSKCDEKIRKFHGNEKRLYRNLETLQAHIKWLDEELEREQEGRDASERRIQSLQVELDEEAQLARGVLRFIMDARR